MHLELADAEVDYIYRLLLARPMGEVEPLVQKMRAQVHEAQAMANMPAPPGTPTGNAYAELMESLP